MIKISNALRLALVCSAVCLGLAAWAQAKKAGEGPEQVEGQVRKAAFQYYATMILGAADEHLKVTRMPLYVVRDGVGENRDEKATRTLLNGFAERMKAAKTTDEDKKEIVKNVIGIFDEASIQFVGSNTAALTFLIHHGKTEKEGDHLGTLMLYKKDGAWKVISEVTDSTAVPPEYLK
jgi:hypothetical protein